MKRRKKRLITPKQRQRVRQAELALTRRINGTRDSIKVEPLDSSIGFWEWLTMALMLGISLFKGAPIIYVLLVLILFSLPKLCQYYGLAVAGFTILSGLKGAFSGQYFPIVPVFPFIIYSFSLSYFCLGWGLLRASKRSRSILGFWAGFANLVGGVCALFQVKSMTYIVAPGYWGSAISGMFTVGFGLSMMGVILKSWSSSKAQ